MFFKPTCCHQYVILSIQAVVPVPGLTRYAFTSAGFFTLPLLDHLSPMPFIITRQKQSLKTFLNRRASWQAFAF